MYLFLYLLLHVIQYCNSNYLNLNIKILPLSIKIVPMPFINLSIIILYNASQFENTELLANS